MDGIQAHGHLLAPALMLLAGVLALVWTCWADDRDAEAADAEGGAR